MTGIRLDPESWTAGYRSGYTSRQPASVPHGLDGLSWSSGRIEGQADRESGRPSQVDPPAEPGPVPVRAAEITIDGDSQKWIDATHYLDDVEVVQSPLGTWQIVITSGSTRAALYEAEPGRTTGSKPAEWPSENEAWNWLRQHHPRLAWAGYEDDADDEDKPKLLRELCEKSISHLARAPKPPQYLFVEGKQVAVAVPVAAGGRYSQTVDEWVLLHTFDGDIWTAASQEAARELLVELREDWAECPDTGPLPG